jgi:hypothetical protein
MTDNEIEKLIRAKIDEALGDRSLLIARWRALDPKADASRINVFPNHKFRHYHYSSGKDAWSVEVSAPWDVHVRAVKYPVELSDNAVSFNVKAVLERYKLIVDALVDLAKKDSGERALAQAIPKHDDPTISIYVENGAYTLSLCRRHLTLDDVNSLLAKLKS